MSIRITRIAALAVAMLFAAGASSQANYSLTTSVGATTGLTFMGALTVGTTYTIPGASFTVGASGGGVYTDAAGSSIYLLNDSQNPVTLGVTNEQIYVNAVSGDSSTFSFVTNILVNGTQAFTETMGTNFLNNTGYTVFGTALVGPSVSVAPTGPISVGGVTIMNVASAATSGNTNSPQNPTVSATFVATVPEPASIAMLGLGLVSVGGFALRRRMAK